MPCRESLERLFAEGPKAGDFGRGSEFALEVERLSAEIMADLKAKTRSGELKCNEFSLANRFVAGLIGEARRPGAVDQVASR